MSTVRVKKVYMTMPGIQDRKSLAWIPAHLPFPEKYKVRAGFGMNFSDYNKFHDPVWHYTYQGKHYWISREKALKVVVKTGMNPYLPDTVPLEEWECEVIPEKPVYVFDEARQVYVIARPGDQNPAEPAKEPEKPKERQIGLF